MNISFYKFIVYYQIVLFLSCHLHLFDVHCALVTFKIQF